MLFVFFSFLSWKCKIKYKKILCAQSLQWREAGEVTVTLALLHVLIYMEDLQRKWEDFLFCLPRWTLTKSSLDVGIWNEVISSSALVKLKCRHLFFVLIFFLLMLKKKKRIIIKKPMIKLFYGSMKASILASSSLAGACTQNLTFICQLFHSSKARGIYCLPKKKKAYF